MADAGVPKGVDDAFMGEDAVGGDEFVERRLERGHGFILRQGARVS